MSETFERDLRRIRMTRTGRWTLLTEKDRARPIHLCDFCAIKSICITHTRLAAIVEDFDCGAVISECAGYRAHLTFRDDVGLEGRFNTVRLGKAWHDRVIPGAKVTLWHAKEDREIGVARVVDRLIGRYCDIAGEHARFNHTQLNLPHEGAESRLMKVLTSSYGTTFMKPERMVSVIYLEREHG